jgi:hypothetical protein
MPKQNPFGMFSAEMLLLEPELTPERKYMTSQVASQFGVSKKTIASIGEGRADSRAGAAPDHQIPSLDRYRYRDDPAHAR